MSSTDPMKDDSSIPSEILRRISLRPSRFLQLQNTKSSLLMKQITQPQMYNSVLGRLQRSLLETAGSSSPVTIKTKLFNPFTADVQSLTSPSKEKKNSYLLKTSSNVSKKSWIRKVLNMTKEYWQS